MPRINFLFLLLVASLTLVSCTRNSDTSLVHNYPILGLQPIHAVTISEDPSEVLVPWARETALRGMTVVYLGRAAGLSNISGEKRERLRLLIGRGAWDEIERSRQRGDASLFTSGNYLAAAAAQGIIKEVIWVVAEPLLEYSDAERRVKQLLAAALTGTAQKGADGFKWGAGRVSGKLGDLAVSVCDMNTLPAVPGSALIILDLGFLADYGAMNGQSGLLTWKTIFEILAARKIPVARVDMVLPDLLSRSLHRYRAREIMESLRDLAVIRSVAPPGPWLMRDQVDWAFTQNTPDLPGLLKNALKKYPADEALMLFSSVHRALRGDAGTSLELLENQCRNAPEGCAALVYAGRELAKQKRYDDAERFFLRATALRANLREGLREQGALLMERKEFRRALEPLLELAGLEESLSLHLAIGDCFFYLDQQKDALEHYERALALFDEQVGHRFSEGDKAALARLLKVYEDRGDASRARTVRGMLGPEKDRRG